MSEHKQDTPYRRSRPMLKNENIQTAIKVLGSGLLLTKNQALETTFTLVDDFGIEHQYHLEIHENLIHTSE